MVSSTSMFCVCSASAFVLLDIIHSHVRLRVRSLIVNGTFETPANAATLKQRNANRMLIGKTNGLTITDMFQAFKLKITPDGERSNMKTIA